MSKHTWLTKPTQEKAARLTSYIEYAVRSGSDTEQAELFAGYCLESFAQAGSGSAETVYAACIKSGWKIGKGKNAENYKKTVEIHRHFLVLTLIDTVWDKLRLGDFEFVDRLSCRDHFLPFLEVEEYQEFRVAVTNSVLNA